VDDHYYDYCESEARNEAAAHEEWMQYTSTPRSLPLMLNDPWLKECPRTSDEIEAAFCADQIIGGVPACEERAYLNGFIRDAGFLPSDDSDNPSWTWEGR